jgi:dTDP-4-dehydrorhamnose reductase
MKVLIVGCMGMLGSDLMARFGSCHQVRGVDQQEMDITRPEQCLEQIQDFRPDAVINAAALTKVDYCESNEREAFLVNGEGAGNLAKAAAECGALLVHYSTDYVFDGQKTGAYLEEDAPNPQSVYGKSKLLGEELVRRQCSDHLILRTSWLFGRNGRNFIRTIVDLARKGTPLRVVNDQRGSPSYSEDVASHTLRMVEAGCRYTYHLTNSGFCTWYDLAVKALEFMGMEGVPVTPVSTREFPRPAPRPANSVLANCRLERDGVPPLRPWQGAVREYIERHLLKKYIPD